MAEAVCELNKVKQSVWVVLNREAVKDLSDAIILLDEVCESLPWNEDLMTIKKRLDNAWDGLTFKM